MKKVIFILAAFLLFISCFPAAAEEADYTPYLWFLENRMQPETFGSGILLWNLSGFRQDLLPQDRLPKEADDVGYVIVMQYGDPSYYGRYNNGTSALIYNLELIAYSAASGAEITRTSVYGGDPPKYAAAGEIETYGDPPTEKQISEALAAMCAELPDEVPKDSVWQYAVREAGDEQEILDSYAYSSPEEKEYLVITPGIEILGYTGYEGGDLVIPSEIDGIPVTAIGHNAFYNKSGFRSITVPDSVTRIGENSFFHIYRTEVFLPDHLTLLPFDSFVCCFDRTLPIPSGIKAIGNGAFSCCFERPAEIILPEGLEYIGRSAFSSGFESIRVRLPRSMSHMDYFSFNNYSKPVKLEIYRDSYAQHFLEDGGWEESQQAYADKAGETLERFLISYNLDKPEYVILDETDEPGT